MRKILPITLIIVVLVIMAAIISSASRTKTVDWAESYNERSNKPYGTSILYQELPKLFKDHKVRTVYHQPDSYLKAHSDGLYGEFVAEGSYLIIGNSDYLLPESIDELLHFTDSGNTLFISDYSFPQKILDTLSIETTFIKNTKDSISSLSLKGLNLDNIKIDKNIGDSYFSSFSKRKYTVLGHSKIDYKHANFLKIPFGTGTIYLHTEPKAFTNYNLLKENRYRYVEGILSYLPENDIYFDSFTKMQTPYHAEVEKESNLNWFLEQQSFRWAWYTAVIFAILFMIFNAKRRQRIIKIITPLQNTSVAFVKTVSNLYFETKDHKNLIDKKITYFLEKIRTDFHLNTSILDDDFIDRLASKAGKKREEVKALINYISWLKTQNDVTETQLIKLNKLIEAFNSK
ncbi:DUF4350 domain-containing protein [Tamlana sp. 2_MG-2023]|uniref:DUF4350 domain-containing protein n=1 Tax=unclassified Tamlana TaxID=2614803 RepID=UPI0026E1DF73|nr:MULTISPECIES: DUF4350 domain-containing protein [unclassified Tamlana]MDO6760342.1 DUF4350 domain-containing protein [Tamlana sp. 2_MG-2023]MDO6789960.1 DUF4350 domain-containing protein [Tamlana sp. 1_MG-2023]